MIKSKKCKICESPSFSRGFCQRHMPKFPITSKGGIKKSTLRTAEKNKDKISIRNIYFDYHIEKCIYSEESRNLINNPTKANICHLIDKGRHPSLQDNLENCIYLTFSEHERFDKLLFSLEFEKLEKEFKNSWDKTCIKYNNLLHLCTENTNFTRELKKYLDGRAESK